MFKWELIIFTALFLVVCVFPEGDLSANLCAYWCSVSCAVKQTTFYCCSNTPSLVGPTTLLSAECEDLCLTRPEYKAPLHERNCKDELKVLTVGGKIKDCHSYDDCKDEPEYDLCCHDPCLTGGSKMCMKKTWK